MVYFSNVNVTMSAFFYTVLVSSILFEHPFISTFLCLYMYGVSLISSIQYKLLYNKYIQYILMLYM